MTLRVTSRNHHQEVCHLRSPTSSPGMGRRPRCHQPLPGTHRREGSVRWTTIIHGIRPSPTFLLHGSPLGLPKRSVCPLASMSSSAHSPLAIRRRLLPRSYRRCRKHPHGRPIRDNHQATYRAHPAMSLKHPPSVEYAIPSPLRWDCVLLLPRQRSEWRTSAGLWKNQCHQEPCA